MRPLLLIATALFLPSLAFPQGDFLPPRRQQAPKPKFAFRATGDDLATCLRRFCGQAKIRLEIDPAAERAARCLPVVLNLEDTWFEDAVRRAVEAATQPVAFLDVQHSASACTVSIDKIFPETHRTFNLRHVSFNDAVRTLLKATRANWCFAYDPADQTTVDLITPDQPVFVSLVGLLRQTPEKHAFACSAAGGVVAVGPDPHRDGSPWTALSVDADAVGADVRYLIRALMAALQRDWTFDVGISGSATLRGHGLTVARALDAVVESCAKPITYRVESEILMFSLAAHPAEIYDYYTKPLVDLVGVPAMTEEERRRIHYLHSWGGRRPLPDSPEGQPAAEVNPNRIVTLAPGKRTMVRAVVELATASSMDFAYGDLAANLMHATMIETRGGRIRLHNAMSRFRNHARETGKKVAIYYEGSACVVKPESWTWNGDIPPRVAPPSLPAAVSGTYRAASWEGQWEAFFRPHRVSYVAAVPIGCKPSATEIRGRSWTEAVDTLLSTSPIAARHTETIVNGIYVVGQALHAAPTTPNPLPRVSLWLEDVPVESALKALFAAGGGECRLKARTVARITIRLRNVPFEAALSTIISAGLGQTEVQWEPPGVWKIGWFD